jgi:serine-type D-Ala-D-Ala carboxypeptidase (penicillin-binding protein 5/6)
VTARRRGGVAALAALLLAALALPSAATAQSSAPQLRGARAAILLETSTGQVAYTRSAHVRRSIASTTKLMTALVTLQKADLDDVIRASSYSPAPVESQIGLRPGERMTVRDLLRGVLLASGNDAAMALAVGVSGSRSAFVRAMNARARTLGLRDTHFSNPIGLDQAGNYSTAADLAQLAIALRRNAFARATMNLPRATLQTGSHRRKIVNRNTLVRTVPAVNGVKTGHTLGAGYLLVGSATRNGITVVSVVMGEPSESMRDSDTVRLLRYGLDTFRRVTGLRQGAVLARVKLAHRDEHVDVVASSTVRKIIRRGQRFRVRVEGVPTELDGPLPSGSRVGTAVVRLGDEVVARVPLVTASAVAEASLTDRVSDAADGLVAPLLLVLVVVGSLLIMVLRRRAARRRRRVRRERRAA